MQVPRTRYAQSGTVNIAYQAFGREPAAGAPTLVLAQPWITHVDLAWEEPGQVRFLEALAQFARVILFDKRGTGASDRNVGAPTLDERMDDIRAVLDATDTEKAALFGCCDGGSMAAMFAAAHPQRTTHLILFGAFATRMAAPDYPWGQSIEQRTAYWRSLAENWGDGTDFMSGAPSRKGDQAFLAWCGRLERIAASPGAAIELSRLNTQIDIRCLLPTIRTPSLVLHRRGDTDISLAEGEYVAKRIPDARFKLLEGEDHLHWAGEVDDVAGEVQEFITGARPAFKPESALVTILCTDIVNSTQRAYDLGDKRWGSLIAQHDAIVASELRRFQGAKINTTGDGVLAAFDSPGRGIRAAMAIQQALSPYDLTIRAGVHTGECELRAGVPSGIALNIGARVADLANAGEILASRTVKDLMVGADMCFEDRGEHALKGVPGEWRIYAVSG
ncbi:MAG: adenylate/guanylate cyclase domain-containing protein [Hyphomonadaceae bacterium]|nr:adenylate/guanylate cyclase domain-containing protein [Hyphomonadaceae bacterium]